MADVIAAKAIMQQSLFRDEDPFVRAIATMQRRIITAVKEGTAPDPAWAALAGARSRHNVYMSVPLVWTMISSHTTTPFASSPVYLLVVILVGWGAVYLLYKKAPKVPGF